MSENKTKEEILKIEYGNARRLHPEQNWGEWDSEADSIAIGINAMQAYADQQLKKPNEFIRDVAKLLGEDGLGFDGLSWTVEDFKNAIDQEKRSTAIAFSVWTGTAACEYSMTDEDRWTRGPQENITTEQLFDIYINSL